ncbi:MAG: hypothetical protein IKV55_05495 [Oscillospiraceae bacterium]|nr:hypothetical protein [Oscillospiraceae bacterium]
MKIRAGLWSARRSKRQAGQFAAFARGEKNKNILQKYAVTAYAGVAFFILFATILYKGRRCCNMQQKLRPEMSFKPFLAYFAAAVS